MNASYQLSESEVVNAMQLHGRGSKKTLAFLAMVGAALVLLGSFTTYKAIGLGGAIGGVVGYFAVLFIAIPFNAKRQYKQHRALRNEITMIASEQGINFKSESGESKLQWDDIHKWKFSQGIYLLYITSNMFHMVPARALSDEGELDRLLSAHVGTETR